MNQRMMAPFRAFPGKVGVYYENLATGETLSFQEDLPLMAASVIKLPILIDAFSQLAAGTADKNELFTVAQEDKLPSCGALNYLHTGLEVTLEDLYTLMIILSDNTATNLLIRRLGMNHINATTQALGLTGTRLNRLLFDSAAAQQGIENTITAGEMGRLLSRLYRGQVVSPAASAQMLSILKDQRLNGKIPFWLGGIKCAHKTGEDDGVTHDVAIVYAPAPFVLCVCGNRVCAPQLNLLMADTARQLVVGQGVSLC